MIKTKTLIKRKSKGGLAALTLLLSLIALVASMLITQSVAEKAEASRFGTCPAGQVLRGQRLSSGGYRLYCVRVTTTTTRAPTTTSAPRRTSCSAGQYRWNFVGRSGCAPCPTTARSIPTGCAGYTRLTSPPTTSPPTTRAPATTRPPATTRAPRPTPTTAAPPATTPPPPRPVPSCSAGQYYLVIRYGAACVPCPTSMLRTALSIIPGIWPACQGHTTLTEPARTPQPPTPTPTPPPTPTPTPPPTPTPTPPPTPTTPTTTTTTTTTTSSPVTTTTTAPVTSIALLDKDDCSTDYVPQLNRARQGNLIEDCKALVDIQNHFVRNNPNLSPSHFLGKWGTGIPIWDNLTKKTKSIAHWPGIRVEDTDITSGINNRVTGILLSNHKSASDNMKLSGSIPIEHISKLSQLKYLHLSNNKFSGTIPAKIGSVSGTTKYLGNLLELSLDGNQLTGSGNPSISSIPSNLANLNNLKTLNLHNNSLTGPILSHLGNLGNLERLRLDNNLFTGSIPSSFSSLTNLFLLRVNNNNLTGSIPTLSSLTKLRWADLSNNDLSKKSTSSNSITSQFNNLAELRYLRLNNNDLTGSLPAFTSLTKIRWIDLSDNLLSGSIGTKFNNLSSLTHLYLNNNQLSGTIPTNLCSLGANLKTAGNNSSFSCPTTTTKKTSTTPTTAAPTTTPTTAAPTTTTTTAAPALPRRQVLYGRGGSSVTFTTTSRPRGDLTISVSNIQIVNTCISNIDSFTISSATSRRTSQTSAYLDYSYVTNFSHRCSPGWLTMATADFTLKWRDSANVEQSSQPKAVTILRRIW